MACWTPSRSTTGASICSSEVLYQKRSCRRSAASVLETLVQVEVLTYAPTEFYHCQHCEIVWQEVGFGQRVRAEQRKVGLPFDLQAEYQAISDWAAHANQ